MFEDMTGRLSLNSEANNLDNSTGNRFIFGERVRSLT